LIHHHCIQAAGILKSIFWCFEKVQFIYQQIPTRFKNVKSCNNVKHNWLYVGGILLFSLVQDWLRYIHLNAKI
jgi:hypothetical protein